MGWFTEKEQDLSNKQRKLEERKKYLQKYVDKINFDLHEYVDCLCMGKDGNLYAFKKAWLDMDPEDKVVGIYVGIANRETLLSGKWRGFSIDPDPYVLTYVEKQIESIKAARTRWLDHKDTLKLFGLEITKTQQTKQDDPH